MQSSSLTKIYFVVLFSLTDLFCALIIADLVLLLHTAILWKYTMHKVRTQPVTQ